MGILIDVVLIAIIIISSFLGYKKGLVKLGAGLFAGILAIILTIVIYKPVAGTIIKNTPIDENLEKIIVENTNQFIEEKTQSPKIIAENIENNIVQKQAKGISQNIVYYLTAIVLFVVVKIVLSIVISLIDFVAKLPILKQFNEIGGLAYGIIRGGLIALILVFALNSFAKINPQTKLNQKIQETYITKTIYEKIIKI